MNTADPTDLSPLSYGAGLTLGLFLILGLPTAPKSTAPRTSVPEPRGAKLACAGEAAVAASVAPTVDTPT
jgi:hypothetical protein